MTHAVAADTLPVTDPPAAADLVAFDLPCTACGYNLRGAAHDGACPECGQSTAVALNPALLRFADPAWLRRLEGGFRWMLVAGYAYLGGLFLIGAGMGVLWDYAGTSLALAPGTFVAYFAWWKLMSAESEPAKGDRAFSVRTLARYGGAVVVLLAFWWTYSLWRSPLGGLVRPSALAALVGLVATVAAAAAHWRSVALRSGDRRVARYPAYLALGTAVMLMLAGATAMVFLGRWSIAQWLPNAPGRLPALEHGMMMATLTAGGVYVAGFGYVLIKLLSRVRRERRAGEAIRAQAPIDAPAPTTISRSVPRH